MQLEPYYNDTVDIGTPITLTVKANTANKSVGKNAESYRVTATGAGTLQLETKGVGMAAFNVDTSISAESVILDFNQMQEIKLTASVANVPVSIAPFRMAVM